MGLGFKHLIKTRAGDYAFSFLFMGLFVTICSGLFDLYQDRAFDLLSYLLKFFTFGILGIIIRRLERSDDIQEEKENLEE